MFCRILGSLSTAIATTNILPRITASTHCPVKKLENVLYVSDSASIQEFIPKVQEWAEDIFHNNQEIMEWVESLEFDWNKIMETGINFFNKIHRYIQHESNRTAKDKGQYNVKYKCQSLNHHIVFPQTRRNQYLFNRRIFNRRCVDYRCSDDYGASGDIQGFGA